MQALPRISTHETPHDGKSGIHFTFPAALAAYRAISVSVSVRLSPRGFFS